MKLKILTFQIFNFAYFSPETIKLEGEGKYSLNDIDFFKINLNNEIKKDKFNLLLNLDYGEDLKLDIINYKKSEDAIANLSLNLQKNKNDTKIINLQFLEGKNSIQINNLDFKDNKISSFKSISVDTLNNNFSIKNEKKFLLKEENLMLQT